MMIVWTVNEKLVCVQCDNEEPKFMELMKPDTKKIDKFGTVEFKGKVLAVMATMPVATYLERFPEAKPVEFSGDGCAVFAQKGILSKDKKKAVVGYIPPEDRVDLSPPKRTKSKVDYAKCEEVLKSMLNGNWFKAEAFAKQVGMNIGTARVFLGAQVKKGSLESEKKMGYRAVAQ